MESSKHYQDGMDIKKKFPYLNLLKKLSSNGIAIKPSLLKLCRKLSVFLSVVLLCNNVNAESKLKTFTADFKGTKVKLSWKLESESNLNYYIVERSRDGNSFETTGLVKVAGKGEVQNEYSFFDKDYIENVIYYRLKCRDNNGKEKALAGIIAVQIRDDVKETAIYPTSNFPYKIYADVSKINGSSIIVDITDADGQKLANKKLDKSQNENAVELKSSYLLQKGDYTMTAFFENRIVRTKLFIRDSPMNLSENKNSPFSKGGIIE